MLPDTINTEEVLQQLKGEPVQDTLRIAAEHPNIIGILADDSEVPPARYHLIHGGTTAQEGWETLRSQQPETVREITREEIEALMTAKQNETVAGFISRYQNYGVNWVKQIIGPKNGLKLTLSLEPQHRKIRKAKNMQPSLKIKNKSAILLLCPSPPKSANA